MTGDSQCWGRFTQVYVSIETTLATASAVDGTLIYSSVIRQKAESRNGCFKFSEKTSISYPWCALLSWKTRFEIRPFGLLPTDWKVLSKIIQGYGMNA